MKFTATIVDRAWPTVKVDAVVAWKRFLQRNLGKRVQLDIQTEDEWASTKQHGYWRRVIVPFVAERWQQERGDALPLHPDFVHDALVATFGPEWVETPLGRSRKSMGSMSKREVSQMIDKVAAYVWERYRARLPEPKNWTPDD